MVKYFEGSEKVWRHGPFMEITDVHNYRRKMDIRCSDFSDNLKKPVIRENLFSLNASVISYISNYTVCTCW